MSLKIGVSGKRNIYPDELSRVYDEIKSAIAQLLEKNKIDDFVGYTSVAMGADTIFADVVIREFKKPIHIILPFDIVEFRKDFVSAHDLVIFNR